jgi:hypothetical protein
MERRIGSWQKSGRNPTFYIVVSFHGFLQKSHEWMDSPLRSDYEWNHIHIIMVAEE